MITKRSFWIFGVTFFTLLLLPGINWLLLLYANKPEYTDYYRGPGPKPNNWQILFSGFSQYQTLAISFILSFLITFITTKCIGKNLAGHDSPARIKAICVATLICTKIYFIYRIIRMGDGNAEIYTEAFDEVIIDVIVLIVLHFFLLFLSSVFVMRNDPIKP